jgi:hypothetical protein
MDGVIVARGAGLLDDVGTLFNGILDRLHGDFSPLRVYCQRRHN